MQGLQLYLQLLHHLDSETVPSALLKESSVDKRAKSIEKALSDLGVEEFSAEDLMKGDVRLQRDILLSIYENIGPESLTELYAGTRAFLSLNNTDSF